jgi:hypothetical protein
VEVREKCLGNGFGFGFSFGLNSLWFRFGLHSSCKRQRRQAEAYPTGN